MERRRTVFPRRRPFAVFRERRPAVLVVSHERSGTHFLMNSIARGYGYTARPWVDMDGDSMPINFFHPPSVAGTLASLADRRIAAIVKSHHSADFFDGILNRVLKRYVVFYIHRDPVEVMLSFWRFMHRWHWHEGPKRPDPVAFASAEPEGQLMRYQRYQCRNMLDRWAKHVEGWHRASAGRPRLQLVVLSRPSRRLSSDPRRLCRGPRSQARGPDAAGQGRECHPWRQGRSPARPAGTSRSRPR